MIITSDDFKRMRLLELLERIAQFGGDISKALASLDQPMTVRVIKKLNEIQDELNKKRLSNQNVADNNQNDSANQHDSYDKPPLLTIKLAAKYLRVSISTIYNLKKSGKLKFHKVGGSYRTTYEELNVYFFYIDSKLAECQQSFISVDKKESEVTPFEKGEFYQIVHENRIWVSLFNKKWDKSAILSKKKFKEYFSVE